MGELGKIDNKLYYSKNKFYNKLIDYIIDYNTISCKGIQREYNVTRTEADKYLQLLIENRIIERLIGKGTYRILIPSYKLPLPGKQKQGTIEGIKRTFIEDSEVYSEFVEHVRKTGRATRKELLEDFKGKYSIQDIRCYQVLLKERNVIRMVYGDIGEGVKNIVVDESEAEIPNDKWGNGYKKKEIELLEDMYNLYVNGDVDLGIQGFEIKSADSYQSLLSICKNKLIIRKLEERQIKGEDVGTEIKKYHDINKVLLENSKLTEKQRTGRDYNLSTIGEIIKQVEMEEYIYPDDTIPDDEIDAVIKLLSHTIANGGENKLWDTREGKIAQLLKKEFGNDEV